MADHTDRLAGALADRYRIERELGAGGMAVVYLASDLKHGRSVAIKVLRPELAAVLGAGRFMQEIRVTANLHHPHILPLHDSCQDESCLYYVMPYVEGETLRTRLARDGRLAPAETIRLLRELADALAHAHRKGVVHRDLKPENILLQDGHALVADFGIARAVSAAGGEQLTQVGFALGTPAYMSPEQATGENGLDGRSDIYALGCVAYEMLAGTPPFAGTGFQQTIAAQIATPPQPLTVRRPDVPAGLAEVIMRCLEKDPARRWQTAEQMILALDALPAAQGRQTGAAEAEARRVRWRPRTLAAAGALVACIAVAWWVVAGAQQMRDPRIQRIAVLPLDNVTGDTAQLFFADGVTRSLVEVLTSSGVRVVGYRSVMRYRGSDLELGAIARELGVDALLVGSVASDRDRIDVSVELTDPATGENRWAQTYSRAAGDVLTIQHEIAREISRAVEAELTPEQSARLARKAPVDPQAYASYLLARAQQLRWTEDGFRRSVSHLREALARDSTLAPAWAELAMTYGNAGWFAWEPDSVVRPIVEESARRALALDSTAVVAHLALGMIRIGDWDFRGAEEEFRRAVAIRPDGETLDFLGWSRLSSGHPAEAIEIGARAVALEPTVAQWRADYGWALYSAGRRVEALAQGDTAVALDRAFAEPRWLRSWIYAETGRFDEAWGELRTAEALAGEASEPHRAYIHARSGEAAQARRILASRDSLRRAGVAVRHAPEAPAYLALGDTAAALDALERGVAAREPALPFQVISNPMLAALHPQPRYQALRRRMGVR